MTEKKPKEPWGPDTYLQNGIVATVIGAVVLGLTYEDAPGVGIIVLAVAGLILQIGIIAKGVEVGNRSTLPTADE